MRFGDGGLWKTVLRVSVVTIMVLKAAGRKPG